MPILEIDGVGDVEVDDSFNKLSAQEKDAFVRQIVSNHKAGITEGKFAREEPGAFDLGYLGGQFKRGLGAGIEDYAKTARVLGADPQNTQPFEQAGQRMQQGAPRSAMERFSNPGANDVTLGGKSLSALPGVVAEGGAGLLADLGAMAAGTAVGGPVGGIAAPIASYGLREYGKQLEERQANNGGAPVTGGDQAAVGASVLAQGALNRLGLKGIAPAANIAERGLLDAGKRIGVATGLEGATSAAQEGVSQVGTVAGTSQGQFEPGKMVDAGLIGGAIGGTVRTAAEVGKGVRSGIAEVSKRGYEHQEVMPDVAAEINKISEAAGRKLGDRFDDAASLKEYAEVLKQERANLNKEAVRAVDAAYARQEINEKQHAMAMEALTADQPTKANVKMLESVVGGKQELQGAVDLAKRSSVVEQLKTKSNYTEAKQTLFKGKLPHVSGGLSRVGERFIDKAKAVAGGAALGGGITYAGLKGLGAFTSTATALTNAAPMLGALVGGYQATKLIDKALGTYSPVRQFVEHNIPKSMEAKAPGGDLPSLRQERADQQKMAQEAKVVRDFFRGAKGKIKPDEAYEGQRFTADDPYAQTRQATKEFFDGAKGKVKAEEGYPGQQYAAEGIERPKPPTAKQLAAEAKARKAAFEEVMGPRRAINKAENERLAREDRETALMVDSVTKADKAALADQAKAAKAKKSAEEKAPKQKGEPPKQPNSEDMRHKTDEIKFKDAYKAEVDLRQQMRDTSIESFIKSNKFKGKKEAYIRAELGKMNGALGNIDAVLSKFDEMGTKYKGLKEKLYDTFYEGGASNLDNYLNRTYKSDRTRGVIKTGRDGDISAGRKRKRDD